MRAQVLSGVAALVLGVSAIPPPVEPLNARAVSPCAAVASSVVAGAPLVRGTPTVNAQLAYDCLNSVPLHQKEAIELVDAIVPYVEWQSDLADLKDPPAEYLFPGLNALGQLATIKSNLQAGLYKNEYQFQADLYQAFAPAHDGHFVFYPDLLSKAFDWGRPVSLVSVSRDGNFVPRIHFTDDVLASPDHKIPAEVTKINGKVASQYVEEFSRLAAPLQDPDSAYNAMFFARAYVAEPLGLGTGYFAGGGRFRYIYPGANTTYEFDNKTVITSENFAYVKGNFNGVTDGESFYKKFCTPPPAAPKSAEIDSLDDTNAVTAAQSAPGYPQPVVISSDNVVSGYYLTDHPNRDTAVLAVLDFAPKNPVEFQSVVQNFIAQAKKDGKKKMVIDLSANGGGYILQGYDLYRQFFPQIEQDGYSRFRENPAFLAVADIVSKSIPADYNPLTADDATIQNYESFFNYRYDLNLTDQHFESFDAKFAPHPHKGDPYTSLVRWDFNDPLTTINETYGIGFEITGYGTLKNVQQPFAAEDIIMVYDGFCSSTCTLFSEFMRQQGGVKSIAMGGRPTTGPIQGVGGVKGAQSFSFKNVYDSAQSVISAASPEQKAVLTKLTTLPLSRSSNAGINLRDAILRDNVDDGTPAQFIYEATDCRLYWTSQMIRDATEVWKAAANAAFNGKKCIAGGLPKRSVEERSLTEALAWDVERPVPLVKRGKVPGKDASWELRHGKKGIL